MLIVTKNELSSIGISGDLHSQIINIEDAQFEMLQDVFVLPQIEAYTQSVISEGAIANNVKFAAAMLLLSLYITMAKGVKENDIVVAKSLKSDAFKALDTASSRKWTSSTSDMEGLYEL